MSKSSKTQKTSDKLKSCTLYVEGMHCDSCEILIEKQLLKQENVQAADASLHQHKVEIQYTGEAPNVSTINTQLKKWGYSLSDKKIKTQKPRLFYFEKGELQVNTSVLISRLKVLAVVASFLIGFWLFERLQLGQVVSVDANSTLPAFFVLGIVAGLSSCAALVGGLLLSMVKQWNELYIDADSNLEKFTPHTLFHLGRIAGFAVLGGILGLIGESISFNNAIVFAVLTVVVSAIMVLLALQMLGVSWALQFRLTLPKPLARVVTSEQNFKGRYMPFGVGLATFFLPCGFTLVAQTLALASGSFARGALIMFLFSLGTFLPLAAISLGGVLFNSRPVLTAKFNIIAGVIILFFAVYNINGQLNVLGLPSLSDLGQVQLGSQRQQQADLNVLAPNEQGEQVLRLVAKGFEYIPTTTMVIRAGLPTKLIVDNQGILGCGSVLYASGLTSKFVNLKRGNNEIDFGRPQAGVYKITCSMGMVQPVTVQVV